MPKLSRWQRDHSACQKTITRQRIEIERLRERVVELEAAGAGSNASAPSSNEPIYAPV